MARPLIASAAIGVAVTAVLTKMVTKTLDLGPLARDRTGNA